MRKWREYAVANAVQAAFVKSIGLEEFQALDWDNPNHVPRMELIKEFVDIADINDKVYITARVRSKLVKVNTSIIHTVLKPTV